MMTNLIMAGILLVLAALLLAGAEYRPDGAHFFNRENSGVMRGFWCLIVVLVHIPAAYQNRVQDMLGLCLCGRHLFLSDLRLRSAAGGGEAAGEP